MGRLVAGFGINDADYSVSKGCPFYKVWHSMVKRCYLKSHGRNRSYYGKVSVCDEWKYFSNFKSWMEGQDWEGKQLDKDLKVKGNKLYSPDTCLFLTAGVNQFLKTNSGRGSQEGMPIGVRWKTQNKKYVVNIRDFRTGKMCHVGYFLTVADAQQAYLVKKLDLAVQLANLPENLPVASYLIGYYSLG